MNSYLISQLPLIAGIAVLLVLSALKRPGRSESASLWVSMVTLLTGALFIALLVPGHKFFGGAISITSGAKEFAFVYLLLTAMVMLLSHGYFAKVHVDDTDWRLIVLCSTLGGLSLIFAGNLPTLFIAFQLVSIPTYALAGFSRRDRRSNEAGMKYLLLGAVAGALLLFGVSLLYGSTGFIELSRIHAVLVTSGTVSYPGLALAALVLMLAALFFKTAAAPFHGYLLDVYQGSSFAATAVIAVPAKVAYFAMMYRLLQDGPFYAFADYWRPVLLGAAVLSFLFGGLQGIAQTNLKRILACSSVLNAGFILLAVGFAGAQTAAFYLFVYGLMTLTIIALWLRLGTRHADLDSIEDLEGLGRRRGRNAVLMSIALLSFAGIPPTAGFFSKFLVVFAVFQTSSSGMLAVPVSLALVIGVLGTVVAAFFYFGLLRAIWFRPGAVSAVRLNEDETPESDRRWNYGAVALLGTALLILLGFFPGLLL